MGFVSLGLGQPAVIALKSNEFSLGFIYLFILLFLEGGVGEGWFF